MYLFFMHLQPPNRLPSYYYIICLVQLSSAVSIHHMLLMFLSLNTRSMAFLYIESYLPSYSCVSISIHIFHALYAHYAHNASLWTFIQSSFAFSVSHAVHYIVSIFPSSFLCICVLPFPSFFHCVYHSFGYPLLTDSLPLFYS